MEEAHELVVGADEAGQRLDAWLARRLPELSRSRLQALIAAGEVEVDSAPARASARVRAGQRAVVRVPPAAAAEPKAEDIPLRIVHEDAALLVIDKPAGLVVHPGAGTATGTLVNALLGRVRDLSGVGGVLRPGIVHRLDRGTSGLLVVAKDDRTHRALARQFAARSVEKEYLALVRGAPSSPRGRIEAPVGRDPRDRQRMAVVAGGREAVTEYELLGASEGHSLLALHPLTGRTHQLRAHLAYLGLPIAGDTRYGGGIGPGGLERQFLHAARLTLDRPIDGRRLTAWSELPPDLSASLAASGIVTDRLPVGIGAAVVEEQG